MSLSSPPGPRRAAPVLATVALTGALTACGADAGSGDSSTTGHSAPPSAPVEHEGATVVTDVPSDEVAEGFVERYIYPVRDGAPDPTQNWADLYLPTGDDDGDTDGDTGTTPEEDTVPLVVFIHGGAWHGGAPGSRHIAADLAARGLAVLNVEYRDVSDGGGWPQTFTDVADALDYVPSIDRLHPEITTDDETVVGHSAGAQLAAWAGTRGDLETGTLGADPKFTPTRVVSLSGPLDLVWAAEHGDENIVKAMKGTPEQLPDRYDSVDPIQNINRRIPVVAVHGTKDTLVPPANSRHYVDAVTRDGGDAKLVMLRDEDHTSFLKSSSRHYAPVLEIIHRVTTLSHEELGDRLDGETTELAEQRPGA
ncbi:prolyl oligopeptidase family serine peptidase [Corynebacterium sp.]|uniref:alpha/beta hydrolase family protein n=1 Tax=Corynebacterium sp. TaxID=1720 RepID=UPI0025BC02F2|nr:prolyl oligopeptidase family serine peptidase [Corynebacterium sp.]